MPLSLNRVTLIGNVGRDPEIRTTQDGKEIAYFSLATSEVWKDKGTGERRERTEWHRVVIFAQNLINIAKNSVRSGTRVYIEGSLHTRKWQDQSGAEKYTTEVVIQPFSGTIILLDGRSGGKEDHFEKEYQSANDKEDSTSMDDEIPF